MDFLNLEKKKHTTSVNKKGMYSDFIVFDNFLPDYYIKSFEEIVKNRISDKNIQYWHSSMGYHPYSYTHWSTGWDNIKLINEDILEIIENKVNKKLKIKRVYSSFQGVQEYGLWHVDDEEDDNYTFTLYTSICRNPLELEELKNNRKMSENWAYSLARKSDLSNNIISDQLETITATGTNKICRVTDKSVFKINDYMKIYSKDNYVPLDNNDSDEIKELKKKEMIKACNNFCKYDYGGDFSWKMDQYCRSVPFIRNRGVFFSGKEFHNGDCFRNNTDYTRIVLSFKLEEIKNNKEKNSEEDSEEDSGEDSGEDCK